MVKENGMVMMTEEEFKRVCKCYEKNLLDQKQEHDEEFDMVCKDYENEIEKMERRIDHLETNLKDTECTYEKRLDLMQKAILKLLHNTSHGCDDVRVSKVDFVEMYQKAVDDFLDKMEEPNFDELPNDIEGYDVTVHWHGIYCNCGNGATPSNHLVPGIEDVISEDPYEDWED